MKKILIVDDDPVFRKVISGLLSREEYQVATAEDGKGGLLQLDTFKPDLLISDVLMPEMDGYQFCAQVRSLPKYLHLPILMLTSLDSVEQKIKGFDVGADDYIVKPFEPREFLKRVEILLKKGELAQKIKFVERACAKTIAVFSLRGGTGVSTIATNVAVGLAQIWGHPTTLVDMVMTGGQSALYLNLPIKNSWENIVRFPIDEIDDYLIQAALLSHESGVFTLASPTRPELCELVVPEKVSKVLSILKGMNEYLVLDLPHDFSETTLAGFDTADVKLVVIQPEIVSIRSASLVLETFLELGYDPDQVHLILNWTFPRKGISNEDIERFLKKKISLVIPYSLDEILHGLNYGVPVVYSQPEETLGMLFEDLALVLSKAEHRKKQPTDPSRAWKRATKRARNRKS
jgi:pilus assembly protein CpaE